jgi:carboxylesterase type B
MTKHNASNTHQNEIETPEPWWKRHLIVLIVIALFIMAVSYWYVTASRAVNASNWQTASNDAVAFACQGAGVAEVNEIAKAKNTQFRDAVLALVAENNLSIPAVGDPTYELAQAYIASQCSQTNAIMAKSQLAVTQEERLTVFHEARHFVEKVRRQAEKLMDEELDTAVQVMERYAEVENMVRARGLALDHMYVLEARKYIAAGQYDLAQVYIARAVKLYKLIPVPTLQATPTLSPAALFTT